MAQARHIHMLRRTTQMAFMLFFFLMPVFDVLRYDSQAKELILLGRAWSLGLREGFYLDHSLSGAAHVALHFFLSAVLPWILVLSIFPLIGLLLGRSFCGWLCPEGALFEFADFLSLKILGRRSLYGGKPSDPHSPKGRRLLYSVVAILFLATIPPLAGIALAGYFVAPATVWQQVVTGELSFGVKAGIIGVTTYMFTMTVLVRHNFCKYVCAPGLMQMLFGWVSPLSLRVRFDRKRFADCSDCKACERACFMDVRPRLPRRDINCVNCGECIVACKRELGEKAGLFGFQFGDGSEQREGVTEGCARPVTVCRSNN